MDKATTAEVMTKHLTLTAEAGIWNHCMGFFGFPGETKEEAWESVQFLEQNKDHVHSLGFGTFDLGRHNPVAKHPDRWGVTAYKNPEWDLALDYYYARKERDEYRRGPSGCSKQFERHHNPGWGSASSTFANISSLYISRFGLGKLADLQFQSAKNDGRDSHARWKDVVDGNRRRP